LPAKRPSHAAPAAGARRPRGPFSLGDPERVRGILSRAGFEWILTGTLSFRQHHTAVEPPPAFPYGAPVADIDALVLNSVNASWRRSIDAATLVACLRGAREPAEWADHVRAFFEDVPREALYRFVLAHEVPPGCLLATYRALVTPEERHGGLESWLAGLADAA